MKEILPTIVTLSLASKRRTFSFIEQRKVWRQGAGGVEAAYVITNISEV